MLFAEGNPPSKYELLAASVAGVYQTKVLRTPRGWGSMDLLVATAAGIPNSELLTTVYQLLAEEGLACRDLQIKAPTAIPVPITIAYSGSVSENVLAQTISAFVLAIKIGGRLEIRSLYKEAVTAYKFDRYEVTTPVADIEAGTYGKLIPTVQVVKS